MSKEKRKFNRQEPRISAYAAVGGAFTWVGEILDVSPGGMAFQYVMYRDFNEEKKDSAAIFIPNDGFRLDNLPCAVLYDIPAKTGDPEMDTSVAVKRCGVQFKDLTEHQAEQLQFFIEHYSKASKTAGSR